MSFYCSKCKHQIGKWIFYRSFVISCGCLRHYIEFDPRYLTIISTPSITALANYLISIVIYNLSIFNTWNSILFGKAYTNCTRFVTLSQKSLSIRKIIVLLKRSPIFITDSLSIFIKMRVLNSIQSDSSR